MCKMRKKFTKIALLLASVLVLASIPAVADEFGTPPDFIGLLPIDDGDKPNDTFEEPIAIETQRIITEDYGDTVISVVIPTALVLTIDPLELAGRGSVYSDTYIVENLGEKAVVLKITDIAISYAAGKEFTPLEEPFSGEVTNAPSYNTPTGGEYDYDATEAGTFSAFTFAAGENTATAGIVLLLNEANEATSTLAGSNAGIAAVQIYGELNTEDTWTATDFKVRGAYTLVGKTDAAYAAVASTLTSLNILSNAATVDEVGDFAGFDKVLYSPGEYIWTGAQQDLIDAGGGEVGATRMKLLFATKPAISFVKNFVSNSIWPENTYYKYDQTTGVFELIVDPPGPNANPIPTVVIDTDAGVYLLRFDYTP